MKKRREERALEKARHEEEMVLFNYIVNIENKSKSMIDHTFLSI